MKLKNLLKIAIVITVIVIVTVCIVNSISHTAVKKYMRDHYNVITIVIDEAGIGLDDLYVKYGEIEAGEMVFVEIFEDLNGTTSLIYGARYDVPCWP